MPPSPSLRRSPGREPRSDAHKRGRSLESGMSFKEKDDDLALFNEMQNKETDNFLLQSNDDFEDMLSTRMKPFPEVKLGINIPVRGESSDFLNVEADKNDYDWLLTPPDTPLFPSLDDDATPANLVHSSGRSRSRPISISRSSTMEKSYRSSRGSPSPQRLSPSPRSGSSIFESRGRPSSAPHSSPSPTTRNCTPSRRPSPPPIKPSTPQPRSSTPTSRRMSTGSGAPVSSTRGTSPVRTNRGNSASPKIKAWQSNIPGFSLEAPPNLRTSLADRPASYVRGSSPASRNSRDSSSKFSRQSISPTASRSISSSHSHERDRFSSHSKGSVASSGDDDADSLHSFSRSVPDRFLGRRSAGGIPTKRPLAFSKKPTKTFSPSSAPKRSFDSAIRQMDRKSPQKMFRPLLSSVPSSTFYSGKVGSPHHARVSRNSSVTTSSNASSDHGISGTLDTEREQFQDDIISECERTPFTDGHDEVFAFDKTEAANEDTEHETHNRLLKKQSGGSACESNPGNLENGAATSAYVCGSSYADDNLTVDCPRNTLVCFRCGCEYHEIEAMESEFTICPDCKRKEGLLDVARQTVTDGAVDLTLTLIQSTEEHGSSEAAEPFASTSELLEIPEMGGSSSVKCASTDDKAGESQISHVEPKGSCTLDHSLPLSGREENTPVLLNLNQPSLASDPADTGPSAFVREENGLNKFHDDSNRNLNVVERAGVSVLLQRSSSSKGPLVQARNVTANAISFDQPSYARTLSSSMRSSVGHGSASTSSSNDFSLRHVESRVQRQLSNRRSDNSSKPQSTGTSTSGTSAHASHDFCLATSSQDENLEIAGETAGPVLGDESPAISGSVVALNKKQLEGQTSLSGTSVSKEDIFHGDMSSSGNDKSSSELYNDVVRSQLEHNCVASTAVENGIDSQRDVRFVSDVEESATLRDPSLLEESAISDRGVEATEDFHQSMADVISETENVDHHPSAAEDNDSDYDSNDKLKESIRPRSSEEDIEGSALQAISSDNQQGINEESTVTVEVQRGRRGRSLTLEEATDTILFCSSIVHNLAYDAASVAIEKENENIVPFEGSRLTPTIVGKTNSERRDQRERRFSKRAAKSPKGRQKHVETDTKPPSTIAETDDKIGEPVTRNVGIPNKVDGTKPPKLESKCNCTIM